MNDRFFPFAISQIWQIPFVVLYICGVIFALNHREIGKASNYAAFGFGALAVSQILGSLHMYLMWEMRFDGASDTMRLATLTTAFAIPRALLSLGGVGLVMAAIFVKRPPVNPSRL